MKPRKAQPVGALLKELFRSPDIAIKIAEGSIPETWRKVVGPVVAAQTRQVRLVRGVLYVHISSSVIRQELMMQREALTSALNQEAGFYIVKSLIVQ